MSKKTTKAPAKPRSIKLRPLETEGMASLFSKRQQLVEAHAIVQKAIDAACADLALIYKQKPAKDYNLDIEKGTLAFIDE